jgi:hypothetical protein
MRNIFPIILIFINAVIIGCREDMIVYNIHHPQLEIQLVLENSKKELLLTTSKEIEGQTFRVSNARCTLSIECALKDGTFSKICSYEVQNISPPLDGGFHGLWVIDDSLLNYHELQVSTCISDTTGQFSCDTIIVYPNEMKMK